MRGLFIVFEGGEGVGKTTQWSRLAESLTRDGLEVLAMREPGGTPAGDALRRILLDPESRLSAETEALLFSASRAQLVGDVILPELAAGKIVLLDRFLLSSYAYQGAGRKLSIEALRAMNRVATRGLVPDLTLLMTMPLDQSLARAFARGAADRMEQEDVEFHRRVSTAFDSAAGSHWQQAHPEIGAVEVIDACGSVNEVHDRCLGALAHRWPARFSFPTATIEATSVTAATPHD